MKTLVVNLFGGACTGKSTLASELFKDLKIKGVDCEIVLNIFIQIKENIRKNNELFLKI